MEQYGNQINKKQSKMEKDCKACALYISIPAI